MYKKRLTASSEAINPSIHPYIIIFRHGSSKRLSLIKKDLPVPNMEHFQPLFYGRLRSGAALLTSNDSKNKVNCSHNYTAHIGDWPA